MDSNYEEILENAVYEEISDLYNKASGTIKSCSKEKQQENIGDVEVSSISELYESLETTTAL